jgi:hypothetical protein
MITANRRQSPAPRGQPHPNIQPSLAPIESLLSDCTAREALRPIRGMSVRFSAFIIGSPDWQFVWQLFC